jgi:hypothetical protein
MNITRNKQFEALNKSEVIENLVKLEAKDVNNNTVEATTKLEWAARDIGHLKIILLGNLEMVHYKKYSLKSNVLNLTAVQQLKRSESFYELGMFKDALHFDKAYNRYLKDSQYYAKLARSFELV